MKTENLIKQANENKNESSINSADKVFQNEAEAARCFSELRTKLVNINEWNHHALMSTYALFDENGREINEIHVGDFIRISLKVSGKYDWIRVIDISDAPDEFIITVTPTYDLTSENVDRNVISHFFTHESTNNFCLFQKNKKVALYVVGLNEKANMSETGGMLETIRNAAVNAATFLGMQNSEWKKFCHHFLEDAAGEKPK